MTTNLNPDTARAELARARADIDRAMDLLTLDLDRGGGPSFMTRQLERYVTEYTRLTALASAN